ncbi:hypothetical protein LCL61_28630 [Amycolatopsis coloradensis]|uniref:Uncharacterized protein n=1 Tax=Amycolatopsis coloradensis TaxID=76021 RepID=A0ACD5BJU9_9PSEU
MFLQRTAVADPEFRAIYLGYDAAFDWSPDDSRLPVVAERARLWFAAQDGDTEAGPPPDPTVTRLAAMTTAASSPAWARIAELARRQT